LGRVNLPLKTQGDKIVLTFHNNSEIGVVVLHEIYGVNKFIEMVGKRIADSGFDVICPEYLNRGLPFTYEEEDAAYHYFKENVGFALAVDRITPLIKELREKYKKVLIVGYSIGATIAWLCTGERGFVHGMAGFYGSRIRDHLDINPQCPVLLIYPETERSFHVRGILPVLRNKINVCVEVMGSKHGFVDPYSDHYEEKWASQALNIMDKFLLDKSK